MFIILGLILLLAAVIIAVAGVLTNTGSAHALTDNFTVLGYHVTGSTGTLFLYGIVVGAVAALGLATLLAGALRTARRGRAARHELKQTRSDTTTRPEGFGPTAEPAHGSRTWRHPLGDRAAGSAAAPR